MKIQKYLLAFAFLTLPATLRSQEMSTIKKFIQENSKSKNGSTEIFIGLRCSSLYILMGAYTDNNQMKSQSENFRSLSNYALKFAYDNSKDKNIDYLSSQMEIMTSAYKDRFLKSKALTGNFSDDPIISADLDTCSEVFLEKNK